MTPHIVLIMTDQQRWDTLAGMGYGHMVTPHLDRLVARGVGFSHAFAQGALCAPSRASVVSGKYVHAHGVERNERWLANGEPNWIAGGVDRPGSYTAGYGQPDV